MLLGKNPFANSRTLPSVIGFWAVDEDFFPDNRIFLLGKSFFANSSGLGCWESSGLLAKSQFPVVLQVFFLNFFLKEAAEGMTDPGMLAMDGAEEHKSRAGCRIKLHSKSDSYRL
jgi:hypothetical protein